MEDVLKLEQLRAAHCAPRSEEDALSDDRASVQLNALPGWTITDGMLRREYRFANYYESIAFVNAAAWIAHREDHHPDLHVTYDRVEVAFSTHSAKGLSINDFICAAQFDLVRGT